MSAENCNERAEDRGQESIRVIIARIDERTKNTNALLATQCTKCITDMDKQETKIEKLENGQAGIFAGASALAVIVGLLINWFRGK